MRPHGNPSAARLAFLFCGVMLCPSAFAAEPGQAAWVAQLHDLQRTLDLTEGQAMEVQRVFKAFDGQVAKDRETLKGDMDGLVEAYHRRTDLVDKAIVGVLSEAQRPLFDQWRARRDAHRADIELREGLALDAAQTATLEALDARLLERAGAERIKFGAKASDLIRVAKKRMEDRNREIKAMLDDGQKESFKQYVKNWKNDPLEQEMFRLREGVLLTETQEQSVREILSKRGGEGPRGRAGGPPPRDAMRPQDQEIRRLLDDQQKVLFDQLMKEQMGEMRGRGPGGPGMGGPGGRDGSGGGRPPGGF